MPPWGRNFLFEILQVNVLAGDESLPVAAYTAGKGHENGSENKTKLQIFFHLILVMVRLLGQDEIDQRIPLTRGTPLG